MTGTGERYISCGCSYCGETAAVVDRVTKRHAKIAETFDDFGPSTCCPDCGSSGQVLHWYTLGRKDAAAAIRKDKNENS